MSGVAAIKLAFSASSARQKSVSTRALPEEFSTSTFDA